MNGVHDMGGMQNMGPVRVEKNEPVFHAEWERRVFAMDDAIDGDWPGGAGRYQQELIPPAEYLRMSYYERWLRSLSERLVKSGLVTRKELETGIAEGGNTQGRKVLRADEVRAAIARGFPATRSVAATAKFHGRGAGTRPQHQHDRAHAPAALRARQAGDDRARPRRVRLQRQPGAGSGREAPTSLLGELRGARAVGARCSSKRFGAPRSVG